MGKEKSQSHADRLLLPAPQPNPALKRTRVVRWVFVVGFFRPRRLARALGTANVMKGGLQQPAGQRVIKGITLIALFVF